MSLTRSEKAALRLALQHLTDASGSAGTPRQGAIEAARRILARVLEPTALRVEWVRGLSRAKVR